jgi:protein ImuA
MHANASPGLPGGLPVSAAAASAAASAPRRSGGSAEPVLARLQSSGVLSESWGTSLWLGTQLARPALPASPTGFESLDAELPGGGWPVAGMTELMLREPGCGEIQLLAPGLRERTRQKAGPPRELVWISPPYLPYAPALQALGLPLAHFTWLRPRTEADAAWAAEQVLRSGSCGAVLWWSREAGTDMLRRLHLAAQEGSTPLFALRPWARQQQSSPSPLRLACWLEQRSELCVHVFKRRGPTMAEPLRLALPAPGLLKPLPAEGPQLLPAAAAPFPFKEPADVVAGLASAVAAA